MTNFVCGDTYNKNLYKKDNAAALKQFEEMSLLGVPGFVPKN